MGGGASMAFQYAPNRKANNVAMVNGAWRVVGSDGILYSNLTSFPAGVKPWPGLDPGMFLQYLTMRSATTAPADGAGFDVAFNQTAPTFGRFVSGSGQTLNDPGPVWNVWVKGTSTDLIELVGGY